MRIISLYYFIDGLVIFIGHRIDNIIKGNANMCPKGIG